MAESTPLVDLVRSRIDEFLTAREPILAAIGSDLVPLSEFSRQFLSGGKRFRAQFCYWGARSIAEQEGDALAATVSCATALEVFHAAALVHDDIIDNSDTRRGGASAHRLFEGIHEASGWAGNGPEYGRAAGILLGDLLLGWSDELLDEGLDRLADRASARRTRTLFNAMRTEVTAGQYLDILEERAWLVQPESELFGRALRVITFKSAKYSVQAPLVIGAALSGADSEQLEALRRFGLPLGIAYQLRDDVLGVFGDSEVTGKPSGDDIREGKRTVLVALARQGLDQAERTQLDAGLGDPGLSDAQIAALQQLIRRSGAVDQVEGMISDYVAEALSAITDAPLLADARTELRDLAVTVTRRTA
ncbi:polyprenyl synthetase family protein [Cryobacterium tepidiphilum]|uniref:Polyprenyl synthetase family protein n=1 Tax=Cryobacterium tepidiphilum TaxID=2486026 RepID=A0A3M8L3Y4_9MICO|nr:polyprenyl synthetase family protein [Cryobacterium tepidiphilum]RNE59438.1 polyprenyl synthetase family protein [Cryobacterium tepidiphilum]